MSKMGFNQELLRDNHENYNNDVTSEVVSFAFIVDVTVCNAFVPKLLKTKTFD